MQKPSKEQLLGYWQKFKPWRTVALVLFLGALTLFVGSTLVARLAVTLTRAAPAGAISLTQSSILGTKLLAKPDGVETVGVVVFLTDSEGKAIPDKLVKVSGMPGLEGKSATTDNDGKVSFTATSTEEGQFTIKATSPAGELPGKVVVTFRK